MAHEKDFYEDETILQDYLAFRHSPESPNEAIEKPAFLELLGDVQDKTILDLGCGDAKFGLELLEAGCASYTGVEPSTKMLELAKQHLGTKGSLEQSTVEAWSYPAEQFNLVLSRLALHYVEDLNEAFRNIHKTLKPAGRFIFSMVHPVITSSDKSREDNALRTSWIVDDYFKQGARRVRLQNNYVTQYHRTLESILLSLQKSGLRLESLREGCPKLENFKDKNLYDRRMRIPLFLILSCRKTEW
jgi:ubiquinone/menaquinone biosynthesis C-methylase UbiE